MGPRLGILILLCCASFTYETASASSCPRETLPCDNGTCIERSKWCDDFEHCPDESDEKYCREKNWFYSDPNECRKTHFLCGDGRCFPSVAKCDGIRDCRDGSDEKECKFESSTPRYPDLRTSTVPRPTSENILAPAPAPPRRNPNIRLTTGKPSRRIQDTDLDSQLTTESRQGPRTSFKARESQGIAEKKKDSRMLNALHRRPNSQQTSEDTQTSEIQQKGHVSSACPPPKECPEDISCCLTPCPGSARCRVEVNLCCTHCSTSTMCQELTPCPTTCHRPMRCPEEEEIIPCPTPYPCPIRCPEEARTPSFTPCPRPRRCPKGKEITPCPTPSPRPKKCKEEEEEEKTQLCPRPMKCKEDGTTPSPTPCRRRTKCPEEEEEEEIPLRPVPISRPTKCPEEKEEEEAPPCPTLCPPTTKCPEEEESTPSSTLRPRPTKCPEEEEEIPPCPRPMKCPEEEEEISRSPKPTKYPGEEEKTLMSPKLCPRRAKCPEEGDEEIPPFPRPTKCPEEKGEGEIPLSPTPGPRTKKCPEEEEEEQIPLSPAPTPKIMKYPEEEEETSSSTPCPWPLKCPEEEERKLPSTPCPERGKCPGGEKRTTSIPPFEKAPSSTPCTTTLKCPKEEINPLSTPCPGRTKCPKGGERTFSPIPPTPPKHLGPTKCPVTKTDGSESGCFKGGSPHERPTDCEITPTSKFLTPSPPLTRRPVVMTRRRTTEESLRMAREWLLRKWTPSHYGWGDDTPRALVALSLSDHRHFYNKGTENSRMKKQLQVLLAVDVLRNNTEVISISRLSLYINAMLASCQDPRDFHGLDLVAILRKRIDAAKEQQRDYHYVKGVSVNPFTYLTLCLVNETSDDDVRDVEDFLQPRIDEQKWRDIQALAIMAYSCMVKSPYLSSPRKMLLDASVNAVINKMEDDGSFGSIYSTALVAQALTAHPVRNWNPEKSVAFLKHHQHPNGSFEDLLATYYIMPVLARKSFVDLQNIICQKTYYELTIESLRNSRLPMHFVRYSLYFGKPIQSTNSKMLRVPVGSNFFQIMKLAAEMDVKFRFEHEKEGDDITVYAISNVPNDAERGLQWRLYLNPNRQVAFEDGYPVTHLEEYNGGVQFLVPEAGDHIVFWYQPYLK